MDVINWQISFVVLKEDYLKISDCFDEKVLAFSAFEIEGGDEWKINLVVDELPDLEVFQVHLKSEGLGKIKDLKVNPIGDVDWLAETYKAFPAFEWEGYYLFGSHIKKETCPVNLIPLEISAATAFGSGEHATTKGCLSLFNQSIKNNFLSKEAKILDMGCGSGILSIAAAKKLQPHNQILGVDIDPISVNVSTENAEINEVSDLVNYIQGNGFDGNILAGSVFDLIFANILANPLIEMAPLMAAASCNIIILSGLLKTQELSVIKAYEDVGFVLIDTYPIKEWQSLLMKKKEAI